jgi:hypothetical protein
MPEIIRKVYIHTCMHASIVHKVLAFDYDKHLELNRLYLDYTSIADQVEPLVQDRLEKDLEEQDSEVTPGSCS